MPQTKSRRVADVEAGQKRPRIEVLKNLKGLREEVLKSLKGLRVEVDAFEDEGREVWRVDDEK